MLKRNARVIALLLRSFDLAVVAAAFPLAYWLRDSLAFGELGTLQPIDSYWPVLVVALLLWIAASPLTQLYGGYRTRSLSVEVGRLLSSGALLGLGVGALGFYSRQHALSRSFVAAYLLLAHGFLVTGRVVVRLSARAARRRGYNTRRFAVVGTTALAREVVQRIGMRRGWGYDFAGYIYTDEEGEQAHRAGRGLGTVAHLRRILEQEVLDLVVVAVPTARGDLAMEVVRDCEERGIPVRVCMDFSLLKVAKVSLEELDGIPSVAFTPVPADGAALAGKRLFDVCVSGLALAVASPVLIAVAVAIRLDSPGPIFFRQRRVGVNGRVFEMWKFRSMCVDAEARLAALRAQNEVGGPVFKMKQDPRITRVGRWIRKTSLDEFPQFWNVLRGEMSVVGPRPPLPTEVARYESWQRRRLSVKPGITCVWQVSGRSGIDFDRWMELDLDYIDNWSLWRDLAIVAKTVPAVLFGRGAQ